MASINLYEVLDLDETCTRTDIKKSYAKMVKECHPSKPTGDKELFELVTYAYNTLIDNKSRASYDKAFKVKKYNEPHAVLKKQAQKYYSAIEKEHGIEQDPAVNTHAGTKNNIGIPTETKIDPKKKEKAVHSFGQMFNDMDRKHGIKRTEIDRLDKKKTDRMVEDLLMMRKDDDIENTHERLFDEDMKFDPERFNEAYEMVNKGHDELVPHSGNPFAYNEINGLGGCPFSSIDKYDDLYDDNNNVLESSIYGPVSINTTKRNGITRQDVGSLKGAKYTKGHNAIDPNYNKRLDELIMERDAVSEELHKLDKSKFNTDNSCGGYGILDKIGIDIAAIDQIEYDLDPELDSTLADRFEKLKRDRQDYR